MAILNEDVFDRAGQYIVEESNGTRSRETGIVASGAGEVKAGAVMGIVTGTGKMVPYAPGASDGSETAAGILFEGCDATDEDVRRTYTARDTEVHAEMLTFADAVTEGEKNTAMDALAALGIIGR